MTPQEAINALKQINLKRVHPFYDWEEMLEVRDIAINALEKQVAKKPQYVDTRFRHHGRKISDGSSLDKCYKCPNCNSHIFHVFDNEKCCKYCGQVLDWSDNNG